ncbi:MAG: hypothetical protein D6730_09795 [Bacteroidetes bacterium]|nr:MAG: hypothetical protein D6730_09795 [Bacteroidota bacterium]
MTGSFSEKELEEIRELYGQDISSLNQELFERLHKQLRQKYHPDKFEQYQDEVVKEMAHEKFKRLEALGSKIRAYLVSGASGPVNPTEDIYRPEARFAYNDLKIELITRNKDLKYLLFGMRYRRLIRGDRFKIPHTKEAYIIIDADHAGRSIGFNETIRMYLTFGQSDPLDVIIQWLYERIAGQAAALIINGERIPVELNAMRQHIRRTTFLGLDGG